MKSLLRLLAVSLALAGCSPQQTPQASAACDQTVSRVLLELDPGDLLRHHLTTTVSRNIRDTLRQAPAIPSVSREIVDDRLDVQLGADADMASALERIRTLGGNDWAVTQQGDAIVEVRLSSEASAMLQADALAASLEAAQRRIKAADLNATAEELAPNRLCVEAPGFGAEQIDRVVDLLTKPGVLTFNFVDIEANTIDYEAGVERNGRIALPDDSLDGLPQVIYTDAVITGADLSNAVQDVDERSNPSINFLLHSTGAQRFGRVTSENVGRPFAIVLDDRIVSAPNIMSPIMGGSGQITGQFTKEEAEQLAIVLRSGALPVKLKVVERQVIEK